MLRMPDECLLSGRHWSVCVLTNASVHAMHVLLQITAAHYLSAVLGMLSVDWSLPLITPLMLCTVVPLRTHRC